LRDRRGLRFGGGGLGSLGGITSMERPCWACATPTPAVIMAATAANFRRFDMFGSHP
jgi:hypothetical protein